MRRLLILPAAFALLSSQVQADPNAGSNDLVTRMKSFKCEVKTTKHELMGEAHRLLKNAVEILEKPSASDTPLMTETFKVLFCSQVHDQDLEGIELVAPLADERAEMFNKVLMTFPKADQKKVRDDLKDLRDSRKTGNG